MCKYFHLHTTLSWSLNSYKKKYFTASNLSSLGYGHIGLLLIKSRKGLALEVFDIFATHLGHFTATNFWTQNGSMFMAIFLWFSNVFLFSTIKPDVKSGDKLLCIFFIPFLLLFPMMLCRVSSPLNYWLRTTDSAVQVFRGPVEPVSPRGSVWWKRLLPTPHTSKPVPGRGSRGWWRSEVKVGSNS